MKRQRKTITVDVTPELERNIADKLNETGLTFDQFIEGSVLNEYFRSEQPNPEDN